MLRDFRSVHHGTWGVVRSLLLAVDFLRFQEGEVLLKHAAILEGGFTSLALELLHVTGDRTVSLTCLTLESLVLSLGLHQHLLGLAFGSCHNCPPPLLPTTDQFLCGLLSSHQSLLPTVLLLPYALDLLILLSECLPKLDSLLKQILKGAGN